MTVRLPSAPNLDPRALRARLEPVAGEHHAGLDELFVELAHLDEQLLGRHDACLRVLDRP